MKNIVKKINKNVKKMKNLCEKNEELKVIDILRNEKYCEKLKKLFKKNIFLEKK